MNRTWFEEKTSPKDVFLVTAALGVATVVVKGTKDLYNWSKKRIGEWWDKRN